MNNPERTRSERPATVSEPCSAAAEHEQAVLKAIRETAFGTIEVTVHQSRIVQITRSEKLRL
ncbi:MAG: putative small protein [Xanthomonadaceae bacterium]|nr:putative small protein [Xanthomonadaceae bacterium]